MFLAIRGRLKSCVTSKGIIASERVVWAHIQHPKLGNIGVAAVYAPNDYRHKTALWQELTANLDKHRPWFFVGDLNMVVFR